MRIWTELLAPKELGSPAVGRLLERFELQPLIALPPERETGAMAAAIGALSARGLPIGIWPLLSDLDGYWGSERNAETFGARARAALDFAGRVAQVQTLALDLEPPIERTRALLDPDRNGRAIVRSIRESITPEIRLQRRTARTTFDLLRVELRARKIETIAAVVPLVLLDLGARHAPWQAVLGTPVEPPAWDVLCPMLYGSMIQSALGTSGAVLAPHFIFAACSALVASVGAARASAALGLAGPGKLGDEASYTRPEELVADVAAARAAGVEDLALYSLDGVLGRSEPERWLEALVGTPPAPPGGTVLRTALRMGARAVSWSSKTAGDILGPR